MKMTEFIKLTEGSGFAVRAFLEASGEKDEKMELKGRKGETAELSARKAKGDETVVEGGSAFVRQGDIMGPRGSVLAYNLLAAFEKASPGHAAEALDASGLAASRIEVWPVHKELAVFYSAKPQKERED